MWVNTGPPCNDTNEDDDEGNRVTLYRAITDRELAFVRASGFQAFTSYPDSVKYFALTEVGAWEFGQATVNQSSSIARGDVRRTIVKTTVPEYLTYPPYADRFLDAGVGGAGPSVMIHPEYMAELMANVTRIVILGAVRSNFDE